MTQDARAFNWDSIPVTTKVSADSAAGAVPTVLIVPASRRWYFGACVFSMTTSAVANNRTVRCYVQPDGANTRAYAVSVGAQAASTTHTYCFAYGFAMNTEILVGTSHYIGLGLADGIELSAAGRILFDVVLIDATADTGDNAGAVTYFVKEAPV